MTEWKFEWIMDGTYHARQTTIQSSTIATVSRLLGCHVSTQIRNYTTPYNEPNKFHLEELLAFSHRSPMRAIYLLTPKSPAACNTPPSSETSKYLKHVAHNSDYLHRRQRVRADQPVNDPVILSKRGLCRSREEDLEAWRL